MKLLWVVIHIIVHQGESKQYFNLSKSSISITTVMDAKSPNALRGG